MTWIKFTSEYSKSRQEEIESLKGYKIPIGSKLPYEFYRQHNYAIPKDHIIYIRLSKHTQEQNSVLVVEPQGGGKTQKLMRMLYYFYKFGWKCIYFNPKGGDLLLCNHERRRYKLLVSEPMDVQLPIINLLPSYAMGRVHPAQRKDYVEFSFKLEQVKSVSELETLKFRFAGAVFIWNLIKENPNVTVDYVIEQADKYYKKHNLHRLARDAVLSTMSRYKGMRLFADEVEQFNLIKTWRTNFIHCINCYIGEVEPNAFMFGKITKEAYYRFTSYKKLVVIDDMSYFVPKGEKYDTDKNIAADSLVNEMLAMGRRGGWDVIGSTQEPDLVNDKVLKLFNGYKILGKIDPGEALRSKISEGALLNIKGDPNKGVLPLRRGEALLIHPDNYTYQRFFMFGPILGHPVNLLKKRRVVI